MKRRSRFWSIAIVFALGISFFQWYACNTNNNGDYKRKQSDSTWTTVDFVMPKTWARELNVPSNTYTVEVIRVEKDSLMDVAVDSLTKKTMWARDTSYVIQIPISQGVDSITKKPIPPIVKTGVIPKKNIKKDYFTIFE